jgi:hypothetical protein
MGRFNTAAAEFEDGADAESTEDEREDMRQSCCSISSGQRCFTSYSVIASGERAAALVRPRKAREPTPRVFLRTFERTWIFGSAGPDHS